MPWFAFFLIVFFTLCFLQKVILYVSKTWKTFPHASHLQRTRILTLWFHLRWVFMLPIGGNFSQHRSHWTNYQTQNRFHMLHIELGFLLHDFIRNSLQGFLNIYHIEWTIWVGSCILECGFLAWIGVSGLGNINFTDSIILWKMWAGHSMLLYSMHS